MFNRRSITALIGSAALVAAWAVPALAAPAAMFDTTSGGDGPYNVDSSCVAVIGFASGFNEVTYEVAAQADAYYDDTGATLRGELHPVALATGVTCEIINDETGEVLKTISGALVGSTAIAVDEVTVEDTTVSVRTCGTALFSDNGVANTCDD